MAKKAAKKTAKKPVKHRIKKVYYNKLIRNLVPQKMDRDNAQYEIRVMGLAEFERELLKKVVEEATSLSEAKSKIEMTSEMADLLDVVAALQRHKKISGTSLYQAHQLNMKIKGGFSKRLFLIWSEDTGYETNERRYPKVRQRKH